MINNFEGVNSLSHFKQNPSEAIEQLEKSGKPLVLTEEGKAKIVVQDAKSYQQLLDTIVNAGIRVLLQGKNIGQYRILFTIEQNCVHILHIRHASRFTLNFLEEN